MGTGTPLPGADVSETRARSRRQRLFEWYIGVAIGVALLAAAFSSKFTTPIHSTFLGGWSFLPLSDWGIACMACAVLTGIVSEVLERANRPASEIGKLAAGSLLFGGGCLFFAQIIIEGANIHFDSSPAVKVTTQIIRIEHSGGKRGVTLHLADWRADNSGEVVKAKQNRFVFHTDVDGKHATFYVRRGYFGVPYAAEFK